MFKRGGIVWAGKSGNSAVGKAMVALSDMSVK
jgi:hypothetical protein